MGDFKSFCPADFINIEDKNKVIPRNALCEHDEAIKEILLEYPNGRMDYGSIEFGAAGNSFTIKLDRALAYEIMDEDVKFINSILCKYGLFCKRAINHNTGLSIQYLIKRTEDA